MFLLQLQADQGIGADDLLMAVVTILASLLAAGVGAYAALKAASRSVQQTVAHERQLRDEERQQERRAREEELSEERELQRRSRTAALTRLYQELADARLRLEERIGMLERRYSESTVWPPMSVDDYFSARVFLGTLPPDLFRSIRYAGLAIQEYNAIADFMNSRTSIAYHDRRQIEVRLGFINELIVRAYYALEEHLRTEGIMEVLEIIRAASADTD